MSIHDILENARDSQDIIITHKSFEHVFNNLSKIQLESSGES